MYKKYFQKNRFKRSLPRKSWLVQNNPKLLIKVLNEAWKHIKIDHKTVQNAKKWKWEEIEEDIWVQSF